MANKGQTQMSFAWIFALIVGAVILFLAIYVATQFGTTEKGISDVQTSKDIGILLNPLETGFESGKTTFLSLPKETRIYNKCFKRPDYLNIQDFGKQKLQVAQKIMGAWSETEIEVSFYNKYIFSEDLIQGKKFTIFSKPFNFPFKVADLIYLISREKKYCFVDAPERITQEIKDLRLTNIQNTTEEDCLEGSEIVCFEGGGNCNVTVNMATKSVSKEGIEGDIGFVDDALMYAAIFTDEKLYECQLDRLMQRVETLSALYIKKSVLVASEDCNTNLNLNGLMNSAEAFDGSQDLQAMFNVMSPINTSNKRAICRLW